MTKDELQDKAVALVQDHKHICLEWATGCGKSLGAIRMVDALTTERVVLVCKESTHLNNWEAELDKHGYAQYESILYASAHKLKGKIDVLILDEVHALTWKRVVALQQFILGGARVIALSATILPEKRYLLEQLCGGVVKYAQVSLAQAIHLGLLPKPRIYVHTIELDIKQRAKYMNIERKMNYFREQEMWAPLKITGLKRKKLTSSFKTDKAIDIVDNFRHSNQRFVCFAADINQANEIARGVVICSQVTRKENARLIQMFNKEESDELFAVKMLRESVNLTKIANGLIVQLDSKALSFYQMLGRCLRHDTPQMHMIVVKGTMDEITFNEITQDVAQYIEYL